VKRSLIAYIRSHRSTQVTRTYRPSRLRLFIHRLDKQALLRRLYVPFLLIYLAALSGNLINVIETKRIIDISWLDIIHVIFLGDFLDLSPDHPLTLTLSALIVTIVAFGAIAEIASGAKALLRELPAVLDDKTVLAPNQLSQKQAQLQLERVRQGLTHPYLLDYLLWRYQQNGEELFARAGNVYPITAFPAPQQQRSNPESVLMKPLLIHDSDEPLLADTTYRTIIEKAKRPLDCLPTYTMDELLVQDGRLMLRCNVGNYCDMIDTCDVLEWELLSNIDHLRGRREQDLRRFEEQYLPLRRRLHEAVSNPVRNGSRRGVTVSLCALIAYYDQGQLFVWLQKRSRQVAVHASLLHAIPSFMFQPATKFTANDFSIYENIYREYLEELFDRQDPLPDLSLPWRYYYNDPVLQRLINLLEDGKAKLYFTGVSVSLLSLRPEIHTLLYIRSPEWYPYHLTAQEEKERFNPNIEWASPREPEPLADEHETRITSPLLFDPQWTDEELDRQYRLIQMRNVVPCGAAAFWFGIDQLRDIVRAEGKPN
jgi:hypothetical protein